jgi:hypothetical protein
MGRKIMNKKIIILLLAALLPALRAFTQTDTSRLRMSLLTVGPGHEELYEPFGHTGIRVIDSISGTDLVYNYGSFNYGEPNFELKFMRGKLLYYMSVYPFADFMDEYVYAERKVEEQELLLGGEEKKEIYAFLEYNLRPENKYYKYDFLFDNCATRVRDIFPRTFGNRFRFGTTLPPERPVTFRQMINRYMYVEHFARFGINLLLGSRVDKVMTNEEVMFLPDFLRNGIGDARVSGVKVAGPPVILLDGSHPQPRGVNGPVVLTGVVLALTAAGLLIRKLRILGRIMQSAVMLVTGLLGCLMLFMWLGTDHQACQNNLNLLWALPTSLLLVFRRKPAGKYAATAIVFLLASLVLHLLRVQELPLTELWPWLLSLLLIYGTIYRRDKQMNRS